MIEAASLSLPGTSGRPGRKSVPWCGASVKEAIKSRRKALRKLCRMDVNDPKRTTALHNSRSTRIVAWKTILETKKNSWNIFLTSFNPEISNNALWNKVHSLCGVQKDRKICLSMNDGMISDERDLTEIFATQFASSPATSNYTGGFQEIKENIEEVEITFDTDEHLEFNESFTMSELD